MIKSYDTSVVPQGRCDLDAKRHQKEDSVWRQAFFRFVLSLITCLGQIAFLLKTYWLMDSNRARSGKRRKPATNSDATQLQLPFLEEALQDCERLRAENVTLRQENAS